MKRFAAIMFRALQHGKLRLGVAAPALLLLVLFASALLPTSSKKKIAGEKQKEQ